MVVNKRRHPRSSHLLFSLLFQLPTDPTVSDHGDWDCVRGGEETGGGPEAGFISSDLARPCMELAPEVSEENLCQALLNRGNSDYIHDYLGVIIIWARSSLKVGPMCFSTELFGSVQATVRFRLSTFPVISLPVAVTSE